MENRYAVLLIVISFSRCRAQDCLRSGTEASLPNYFDPGNGLRINLTPLQAIITSYQFHCCGIVSGWAAHVEPDGGNHDGQYNIKFQIWRPESGSSNGYVKVGESAFSMVALEGDGIVGTSPANERLQFQPGDVVGYYLEQQGEIDSNGGLQFDENFIREEFFYDTGNAGLQNECTLTVGAGGELSSSTSLGPIISVSFTTTENACPGTFTSTMDCIPPLISTPTAQLLVATSSFVRTSAAVQSELSPSTSSPVLSQAQLKITDIHTELQQTSIITVTVQPTHSTTDTTSLQQAELLVAILAPTVVVVLLVTFTVLITTTCVIVKRKHKQVTELRLITYRAKRAQYNDDSIPQEPQIKENEAYGKLTEVQGQSLDYDYVQDLPELANSLPPTQNPAYGKVTMTTNVDDDYYVNEGLGGAAELRIDRNEAYGVSRGAPSDNEPSYPPQRMRNTLVCLLREWTHDCELVHKPHYCTRLITRFMCLYTYTCQF